MTVDEIKKGNELLASSISKEEKKEFRSNLIIMFNRMLVLCTNIEKLKVTSSKLIVISDELSHNSRDPIWMSISACDNKRYEIQYMGMLKSDIPYEEFIKLTDSFTRVKDKLIFDCFKNIYESLVKQINSQYKRK